MFNFEAARQVLRDGIAQRAFPGAAWGVLERGELVASEGVGGFTYDPDAPEVTSDTIYDLASVTKVMATTAIAMLMHQQGRLDLEAPLVSVLPQFAIAGQPERDRVTIHMLLAHSSGLPAHQELWRTAKQPNEALTACLQMPLEKPPGARTEYSDIAFILLGAALEHISGMSLREMFAQWLAAPLGLNRTEYGPLPKELAAQTAPTRDNHFRNLVLQGDVHDDNCAVLGGAAGHAGLFAPVGDVLQFADAILRPEKHDIFTRETVELFTKRQTEPAGTTRTLGWDTPSEPSQSGRCFGPRSVGHLGYSGTSLWLDLDRELAVVLLTNRVYTAEPMEPPKLIQQIRPAFHDALLSC